MVTARGRCRASPSCVSRDVTGSRTTSACMRNDRRAKHASVRRELWNQTVFQLLVKKTNILLLRYLHEVTESEEKTLEINVDK